MYPHLTKTIQTEFGIDEKNSLIKMDFFGEPFEILRKQRRPYYTKIFYSKGRDKPAHADDNDPRKPVGPELLVTAL